MAGQIFIRERRKVEQGEKKPRFRVVATHDTKVKFKTKHLRKQEVDQIAKAVGVEVVILEAEKGKEIHPDKQ